MKRNEDILLIQTAIPPAEVIVRLSAQIEPDDPSRFLDPNRWIKEIRRQLPHWRGAIVGASFEVQTNYSHPKYAPKVQGNIEGDGTGGSLVRVQLKSSALGDRITICLGFVLFIVLTLAWRREDPSGWDDGAFSCFVYYALFTGVVYFIDREYLRSARRKIIEHLEGDVGASQGSAVVAAETLL